jgi:hypothetical protein
MPLVRLLPQPGAAQFLPERVFHLRAGQRGLHGQESSASDLIDHGVGLEQ